MHCSFCLKCSCPRELHGRLSYDFSQIFVTFSVSLLLPSFAYVTFLDNVTYAKLVLFNGCLLHQNGSSKKAGAWFVFHYIPSSENRAVLACQLEVGHHFPASLHILLSQGLEIWELYFPEPLLTGFQVWVYQWHTYVIWAVKKSRVYIIPPAAMGWCMGFGKRDVFAVDSGCFLAKHTPESWR